jgi:hypothetical protein
MESSKTRTGWYVFAGLLGLTAVEFWLASVAQGPQPAPVLCGAAYPIPFLAGVALLKAGLIVYFFMHIGQLWRKGGH